MDDPEAFLGDLPGKRVVLDEIHRLENPSQLLKIAVNHFPDTKVLATGPSTLGASSEFRDTLSRRKQDLWLTPMMSRDLGEFGNEQLRERLSKLDGCVLGKRYSGIVSSQHRPTEIVAAPKYGFDTGSVC